jgi:carbon catabolite-derepressing protein kinase
MSFFSFLVAEFAEAERDAQLAAMDVGSYLFFSKGNVAKGTSQPRNTLSPSVVSPVVADLEENPFEAEFNAEYADGEDVEDDELDFISPPPETGTNFAVLNSSLPEQLPEQHHLTSYVSAKRSGAKEKKQHKTKWHFGIRSRSPPMEVMLEIYRTLKTLGMEWKEKKNLGGLGGLKAKVSKGGMSVERARELDGGGGVDLRAASSIYFVETRARVQDVVVCILFFFSCFSFFPLVPLN